MRSITVSFGKGDKAAITAVKQLSWESLANSLTTEPPESEDKASRGWYIPATFNPVYRHGDNFVSRDAITFDFDHVGTEAWATIKEALEGLTLCMYTTHSHSEKQTRFRVVVPLSRPTSFDEFQAISRKLAARFGIELAARESFTPSQMCYLPLRSPRGLFDSYIQNGSWADVDAILAEYQDWTNPLQWPRRASGDEVHAPVEGQTAPDQKDGPVGRFCRAFRVADAISKFELPYTPAGNGRWTYALGSVAEGAIEYDDGLKFHSHHDTDPARGQQNAFDLVRLHRYGKFDAEADRDTAVQDLPSYRSMVELVASLPECGEAQATEEFEDLGPLKELTELSVRQNAGKLVQEVTRHGDHMYPEALRYKARDGNFYRSKSERDIVEALRNYSVPFDYEQPWAGFAPDFTMRSTNGRSVVWEHFGRDDPKYLASMQRKKEAYAKEGCPGRVVVFTTEADEEDFEKIDRLVSLVKAYLQGDIDVG